jgi:hypothetical protein
LGGALFEDLRVLTDEYDGPVSLGNELTLVWASDWAAVGPFAGDPAALADRLGCPRSELGPHVVLCAYERTNVPGTLHVPRALDAVDQEHWRPNNDCSARHGWTRPASRSEEDGFPEVVHRSCTVTPEHWELASV